MVKKSIKIKKLTLKILCKAIKTRIRSNNRKKNDEIY